MPVGRLRPSHAPGTSPWLAPVPPACSTATSAAAMRLPSASADSAAPFVRARRIRAAVELVNQALFEHPGWSCRAFRAQLDLPSVLDATSCMIA